MDPPVAAVVQETDASSARAPKPEAIKDSKSTVDIAKGWTFFAAGTANRENAESHRDGINVRDYIANTDNEWWGGDGTLDETLRRHNCLTSQTDS